MPLLLDRRSVLRLFAGGAIALTGCRDSHAGSIVVGSKNFTEQIILGELLAQMIEAHTPWRADRRLNLGGTFLCQEAMVAGRMDCYVEYTGTALIAILHETPSQEASVVYREVRQAYHDRFSFYVGPPLGFNNTFAIVIRGDDARRLHLRTISDLVPYAPQWRAGFGYEFMDRPDGYRGLIHAYGLKFASEPSVMDLGLLYRALQDKQVDVVAGNSTDGLIAALGLVALEDDRHFFPPYQAVTVTREQTLRRYPRLRGVLDSLGGKISEDEMRRMNYAVDGQHRQPPAVVRDFRRTHGL
jgi:osmoprotectant transport system substrate-binding protein